MPAQIETGENNKQKENTPKNKKFRSVSTHLSGEPRNVKIQKYGSKKSRSEGKTIT